MALSYSELAEEYPMQYYNDIINKVKNTTDISSGVVLSKENRTILQSIYGIALSYFHGTDRSDVISSMIDIIIHCIEYNLSSDYNLLLCILLNTLKNYESVLDDGIASKLIEKLNTILPELDMFTIGQIKSIAHVFPHDVWALYPQIQAAGDSLNVCKEYLQLIRDPTYTLWQFVNKLSSKKEPESWKVIFDDMKRTLFTNRYGGTDYRSLTTMKNKLFSIENAALGAKTKVLKSLLEELIVKSQRPVLLFSQLSPYLTKPETLEKQREDLRKLFNLPHNVHVVKFSEQIQVYRDSIRRPCLISVVLNNGSIKRYLIKTGEPLSSDASVQRAIAILPKICNGQIRSFRVTTLSEESGIIEYLEDHERFRQVMGDQVNVPVNRLVDDKLVLSPSVALEQYTSLCNKLPVYTLRSCIENRCGTIEEFIAKKQMFMETISTMTITNWLFGVGDRHLHNIMFSKRDGGVCGVDWATTFQYGLREYVPARLTGNILAVCDVKVLESRLQSMLRNLKENRILYEAFVMTSFAWSKQQLDENTYISAILEGRMNSRDVTYNALNSSDIKLKEECILILDSALEMFAKKDCYTVEEQVSCLLRHCTSPKLLSIIPQGWEPWL